MTPNLERAATAAAETLIKYNVTSTPVAPLRILKSIPGVIVLSFAEMASGIGMERKELMDKYAVMNKDAFTLVKEVGGKLRYFVGYNMLLPEYLLPAVDVRMKDRIQIDIHQVPEILIIAACERINCLIRKRHRIQESIDRSFQKFYKRILCRILL